MIAQNFESSDSTVFDLSDDKGLQFRITITKRSTSSITGVVDMPTEWVDNAPSKFERYLKFYMKWDGCCHVWMGEPGYGGKGEDGVGYLHLCGASDWGKHIWMMRELWKFAVKTIPMTIDFECTHYPID